MGWVFLFILLMIVGGVFLWGLREHNHLITLDERVGNASAQIATQAESRWDALISLSNTVKQYNTHEADTLADIISRRSPITSNSSKKAIVHDDVFYERAKVNVQAVAEQYPDLKANTLYNNLMSDINQYEDNIRHARMLYNDTVTRFNRQIRMFPSVYIANINGYTPYDYFESSEEKQSHPMTGSDIGG